MPPPPPLPAKAGRAAAAFAAQRKRVKTAAEEAEAALARPLDPVLARLAALDAAPPAAADFPRAALVDLLKPRHGNSDAKAGAEYDRKVGQRIMTLDNVRTRVGEASKRRGTSAAADDELADVIDAARHAVPRAGQPPRARIAADVTGQARAVRPQSAPDAAAHRLLTRRERAALKYAHFVALHAMWRQYFAGALGLTDAPGAPPLSPAAATRVPKVDLHGAELVVQRAVTPTLVGLRGLVAQETAQTFVLVTRDSGAKVVPKQHTVFALEWHEHIVLIYGDYIRCRAAERTSRKFKSRPSVQLTTT